MKGPRQNFDMTSLTKIINLIGLFWYKRLQGLPEVYNLCHLMVPTTL